MNDEAVDQAVAMKSSGIRTCEVHKLLANEAGGGHNLGYTRTDLYNKLYRHSRSRICNGDANAVLMYMDGLRKSEKSFVYSFTKDEEDRLEKLFWIDSKAVMDFAIFGDVIAFDTTYKKNTYNMPLVCIIGVNNHNQTIVFGFALVSNEREETFTWLLEEFVKAMGKKRPMSVVTDGDKAMQRAIETVLPGARHRLCVWHLARNANSNIPNPEFVREFVGCMLRWCTTEEFDRAWWAMVGKFDLYENPWIIEKWDNREMWAQSYLAGHFFATIKSTSRCEGMNSYLKRYTRESGTLLEFVEQLNLAVANTRMLELEEDFKAIFTKPVLSGDAFD